MEKGKNKLVSVIVPIYKVEDDLEVCVNSIINQTYRHLEIILVDDGSPDRCGQICDNFAKEDIRIKVIHKENGGLSDARNTGINVATGDFFTFVDSDDKLEPKFVETLLVLLMKYNAEIAVCRNSVFSREKGEAHLCDQNQIEEICFESSEAMKHMLYQKKFDVSAWGKMYARGTFKNVCYPKGYNFEDIPTTYKALARSCRVVFTSKELYCYQIRQNSIENEKFSAKKMDCIATSQMMLNDIEANYPQYLNAARSRYVAAHFHILAQIKEDIPEKEIIKNNVKRVRKYVIIDREASIRVRGACLLTYLGFTFTVKILNHMNKHKYY